MLTLLLLLVAGFSAVASPWTDDRSNGNGRRLQNSILADNTQSGTLVYSNSW